MTAVKHASTAGERVELTRYTIASGNRILYGQRINGVVGISDVPAQAGGRASLVERELECDGFAALQAIVTDYVAQATRRGRIPMTCSPVSHSTPG